MIYLCRSSQAIYNCDLRQGAYPTLEGPLPDQEKLSICTAQIGSTPIPLLFFHFNQSHLNFGEGFILRKMPIRSTNSTKRDKHSFKMTMLGRDEPPSIKYRTMAWLLFLDQRRKVICRVVVEISFFVEAFLRELSQNFNVTLKAKYQSHNQIVLSMDID